MLNSGGKNKNNRVAQMQEFTEYHIIKGLLHL